MAKKCLLFVEDYPVVGQMYVEVLKKDGFEVTVAPTGEEALAKTDTTEFDVIVVDLLLPKMNGVEFLKKFKQLHARAFEEAKIVVFTDFDDPHFVKTVHDLGIKHYWMKVDNTPHQLADKIKKVLKDD